MVFCPAICKQHKIIWPSKQTNAKDPIKQKLGCSDKFQLSEKFYIKQWRGCLRAKKKCSNLGSSWNQHIIWY